MKKMSKNVLLVFVGVVISFVTNVAAEAVISSGAVSYSNTTVSAALDELFSAVDINNKIGTTDISTIGDGTITGAISTMNSQLYSKDSIQLVHRFDYSYNGKASSTYSIGTFNKIILSTTYGSQLSSLVEMPGFQFDSSKPTMSIKLENIDSATTITCIIDYQNRTITPNFSGIGDIQNTYLNVYGVS